MKIINKCKKACKENWITTTIIAFLWLILGWLKSFGIHSILLLPFNFLTGALTGLDGGSFVGGIVGKTILLMLLNSFIRPLLLRKGNKKERVKMASKTFFNSALQKIPQYDNLKQLFTKEPSKLCYNAFGFGMAFLVYPFVTGNGSLQNSFVCVLASLGLFIEAQAQRGFIITVLNNLLKKKGKKQINKDNLNRLISGNALGFAVTFLYSAVSGYSILSYLIGMFFIITGFVLFFVKSRIQKSEVEAA
ncbi:hypothetical protein [Caproiciproducens faecalis]|uniref:Uncharacterized protein n=1 Tax=Caproiciproducens faecalis TaxID=2820301 RepID=A0ABS7DMB4_9FIRM|nr:hypothetical protein [Caproiciproducens faecalis]MBW7572427.1 hypothetical protein [Caproiciproducens faecalis]